MQTVRPVQQGRPSSATSHSRDATLDRRAPKLPACMIAATGRTGQSARDLFRARRPTDVLIVGDKSLERGFCRLRCAVGAGHGSAMCVRLTTSDGVRATSGNSVLVDRARGRGRCQLSWVRVRMSCIRSCPAGIRRHLGLPASPCWRLRGTGASWPTWHRQAEGCRCWCIRSACGSSAQVSKVRCRFSTWQQTDGGDQWL
jgi:hypothetical protein